MSYIRIYEFISCYYIIATVCCRFFLSNFEEGDFSDSEKMNERRKEKYFNEKQGNNKKQDEPDVIKSM
jgi:hypothetical protein